MAHLMRQVPQSSLHIFRKPARSLWRIQCAIGCIYLKPQFSKPLKVVLHCQSWSLPRPGKVCN